MEADGHAARYRYLDGSVGSGLVPVAELPVVVVAPGVQRAVAGQRQVVVLAGGDGREGHAARERHLDRRRGVGGGAVTELAEAVVAPGVDLPFDPSARLSMSPAATAVA